MTSTMTYGSGYNNWGGSGYNDCVQKCIADFGPPPSTYTPSSSYNSNDGKYHGSTGSGTTHTVIVAPTQGMLKYVPFAVNASVGDTVKYVWGANNHTVTKSSALELCNKTSNAPFASGTQNKTFEFTQVVNDTNPVFFYCGTPGHCEKGMFGMINGASAAGSSGSVASMMSSAVANSSDMAAMMAYTNTLTANNTAAANWGQNIDISSLPGWAQTSALENVLLTRAFLALNPEALQADGSIKMDGDAPLMFPTDMTVVNNAVDAAPSVGSSSAAPSSASAAADTKETSKSNGAVSKVASTAVLGAAAFAAVILAL
ncbi:uncharacterized protein BXZ73DRAFT_37396 [Epithele typhae]|uniref:uncharacterized protein n=1 Tax=Epithele typhae TaxID=378194 RepID=UPI00200785F2|nr:uncharacterized protein BXZ73DRAFT_37396 [Epithele typhae]KAH9946181.1 hypothetical protein BXZ73DRAFT_37396 [Epithele typhae]